LVPADCDYEHKRPEPKIATETALAFPYGQRGARGGTALCTPPDGTTLLVAKTDDAMRRVRADFKRCF
jgi:hypothetical protein